jgi:murein DD-endopeptidase MepM/ murein hydrolase activator NlpD
MTNDNYQLPITMPINSTRIFLVSFISVSSLFGGNLVLAQTEAAIDNSFSSPSPSTPINAKSAKSEKWQRLRQKLNTSPVRRSATLPTNPTRSTAIQPKTNQPKTNIAADASGAYIDPTGYNLGATTGYEAPSSIVLKSRISGCRAVARPGLSSLCRPSLRQQRLGQLARSSNLGRSVAPLDRNSIASGIRPIQLGPIDITAEGFRVATNLKTQRSVLSYDYREPQTQGQRNFMFPLTVPSPVTSVFGWRVHPLFGDVSFHSGTDLGAPLGTPVLAAYPGTVEVADYVGGYGLTVVLNHNKNTLQTLYGHLSEIFVTPGETIQQGTVIGRVGSTGNSTGPHLHFETRQLTANGWIAVAPEAKLETGLARLDKAIRLAGQPNRSSAAIASVSNTDLNFEIKQVDLDGLVALDPGAQLESAVVRLVDALRAEGARG